MLRLFALAASFALATNADARPTRGAVCANGQCSTVATVQVVQMPQPIVVQAPPVTVFQGGGCQGGAARASGCSGSFGAGCAGAAGSSARSGLFSGNGLFHRRASRNAQTVVVANVGAPAPAAAPSYSPMETARATASQWKSGPLPAGTWNWGAVTTADTKGGSFLFADFRGDHVVTPDGRRIEPAAITLYNNSIELPPPR